MRLGTHMIGRPSILYHRIQLRLWIRLQRQGGRIAVDAQPRRLTVAGHPGALQLGYRGGRLLRGRRHVRSGAERCVVRIGRTPIRIGGRVLRRQIGGRRVIVERRTAGVAATAERCAGAEASGAAVADAAWNPVQLIAAGEERP